MDKVVELCLTHNRLVGAHEKLQVKYKELLKLMDKLVNFDHYSADHDVFINAIQDWYKANQDEMHEYRKSQRIPETDSEKSNEQS